jgi:predicted kinase
MALQVHTSGQRLLRVAGMCYKRSMQKWRNRPRRRPKKAATEEAGPQPPPLQPAYPGMSDEPEETPSAEPEGSEAPIQRETQPETVAEAPVQKPSRRRRRGSKSQAEPAPAVTPVIEPGSATGEAAEIAIPDLPEEPPPPPLAEPVPAPEAAPEPPPAVSGKPGKKPKGAVVLAIGLPGSGKSTWFKRHGVAPLSSDLMRHLLFDNVQEQRFQDLVFSTLRSLLRARMIARMAWNYVDATNLSPKERRHWIKMAQDFGYEVHAVYFDVPLEVCMERNQKRHRIVPEDVMQRMSAKLKAPDFDEGFSKITVVKVKQKKSD